MSKKYEFTGEVHGKLKRIRALRDFGDVKAGDLGGWIESEDNLSHDGNCWVYGKARVSGKAQVFSNARVFGGARVYGKAWVFDDAQVFEDARVFDNAWVFSKAWVGGSAQVFGDARVFGSNHLKGSTVVTKPFTSVVRSDGFEFSLLRDADGKKVVNAGCRYFELDEAIEHWEKTRGGTPLGEETLRILKFLETNYEE